LQPHLAVERVPGGVDRCDEEAALKRDQLSREALEQVRAVEHLGAEAKRVVDVARAELERVRQAAAKERESIATERAAFDALIAAKTAGAEIIADAWADYEDAVTRAQADQLRIKSRRAPKGADALRERGKEMRRLRREAKLNEWIVRMYEYHFPWLAELRDLEEEAAYLAGPVARDDAGDEDDPTRHWLSADEYRAMSSAERNQRALDRYLASRKSPWELGRDYERYVGYLREQAGAKVSYHGIFKGLEDLGRDLLVDHPDGHLEVVQCKRWAKRKTVHEKHVFQLFGTVVAARLEHKDREVAGTFTTTTELSERARAFASELGIAIEEGVPLGDYPRIKCNIAREGERIYHLPFDQQYDTTIIEPARGELYAWTVAEAEEAGFRRAWRWRGPTAATSA
jgi:hypothetical protein